MIVRREEQTATRDLLGKYVDRHFDGLESERASDCRLNELIQKMRSLVAERLQRPSSKMLTVDVVSRQHEVLPAAAAIEFVGAAFDAHIRSGLHNEATTILAGDALLSEALSMVAFELNANEYQKREIVRELFALCRVEGLPSSCLACEDFDPELEDAATRIRAILATQSVSERNQRERCRAS